MAENIGSDSKEKKEAATGIRTFSSKRKLLETIENLQKEGKITILKGSPREFNFRWWGMGVSMLLFGLLMGWLFWGFI